jgi:hypothetical protein
MKLIPYSNRVTEILFEPKTIFCSSGTKENNLGNDCVCYFQVLETNLKASNLKNVTLTFLWQDKEIYKLNISKKTQNKDEKNKFFKFQIPKSLANQKIKLLLVLKGKNIIYIYIYIYICIILYL